MAHDQDNNNVNIPIGISWMRDTKEPTYRSTTVTSRNANESLNIGARTFGKSAAHADAFSIPHDISGGAIDIQFNGNNNYPSIQPLKQMQQKQAQPLIEVIADQVLNVAANNNDAPLYDGFQPHYAHHSNSMNPMQMQQTLESILSVLEKNGSIDFYAKTPFIFAGRAFGSYNDCEFLLSIFSDPQTISKCIVEIRRSSGETFEYANIENNILKQLIANGAIIHNEDDDEDNNDDDDNNDYEFGFSSLPSLDSMDLDSTFSTTDVEEDDDYKSSFFDSNQMDINKATKLLSEAVDLDSMRDVLRSDIAHLNEQMAKHEDAFKQVPDIISTLAGAINEQFYDCWGIKMYLGMISKLISISAPIPSSLYSSIEDIETKWCHMVVNQVAPGIKFEFYPSQQIVRCCNQIMDQLQSK